ncbi:MAG: hypothetical protein R3E58_12965 [Phycisphaerae bacterium]
MFQKIIQSEAKRQGLSGYRIGMDSGIPIRTVQRYLAGDCDLVGEPHCEDCGALGLELRPTKRKRKG